MRVINKAEGEMEINRQSRKYKWTKGERIASVLLIESTQREMKRAAFHSL